MSLRPDRKKDKKQENTLLAFMDQQYKHLRYEYDLISGNVNAVYYQEGEKDSYVHRYAYDADNRIQHVETSNKGHIWDMDAKYFYYLHGPLARTELGHYKVQGMDYAYTIQGWLKGVNAGTLDPQLDMGKDGVGIGVAPTNPYLSGLPLIHEAIGRDAFGMVIGYFEGDYTGIATHGSDFLASINTVNSGNAGNNLYNGNIRHIGMAMMDENQQGVQNSVSLYRHDQLNRLKMAEVILSPAGLSYNGGDMVGTPYQTTYKYDANGNITYLTRKGDAANLNMDDFTYNYESNRNRLTHVNDAFGNVTGNDLPNQTTGNYTYDSMGNLIADASEEIESIEWDVRGKVRRVTRTGGSSKSDLEFFYDAMGQRVMKIEYKKNVAIGGVLDVTTIYARDATGNVMAVYTNERVRVSGNPSGPVNIVRNTLKLDEHNVYGSGILGMETYNDVTLSDIQIINLPFGSFVTPFAVPANEEFAERRMVKMKRYFLTDHQMSVRIQVSDLKLSVEGNTGQTGYYLPDVVSWADYYSFGQLKNGRYGQETGINTRYKHQGQESDSEVLGEGNSYAYTYRMSDARLGRFWSVDPLASKYPYWSPYSFSGNLVINSREMEGLQPDALIWNGHLTTPVRMFLHGAFEYTPKVMSTTEWYSLTEFEIGAGRKGGAWTNLSAIAREAINNGNKAITLGPNVVFDDDLKEDTDIAYWFSMIAHEQKHREQINSMGWTKFYGEWLYEYFLNGSGPNNSLEGPAYYYGMRSYSLMDNFMETQEGQAVRDIITNEELGTDEKSDMLYASGLKFRKFRINDVFIRKIESMDQSSIPPVLHDYYKKLLKENEEIDMLLQEYDDGIIWEEEK